MRVPRIYQPAELNSGQSIVLDSQAAVHLTRVLRLKVGDELRVFSGAGGEYRARVSRLGRREAQVELLEYLANDVESPLVVTLLQGVSRGERMDYTVQKAVELGVAHIVPLITERTVVNLDTERREKRRVHWQAVVASACEQSGRNRLPEVAPIQPLTDCLAAATTAPGLKLVLHHRADQVLIDISPAPASATILIGPEGGLAPAELDLARDAGFQPLRLGPRVLRTETAAVAALSVLQWMWGDLALESGQ